MDCVRRLIDYIRPYKAAFFLSVLSAVGVAAFWCANIATVGPMMEVLVNNDSLHDYVERRISTAKEQIETDSAFLKLAHPVQVQARVQTRIAQNTYTLQTYTYINKWLIPLVPKDKFNTLVMLVLAVLVGTLIKSAFIYLQEVLVGYVVTSTANDLRKDCFLSAQRLDLQSVANEGTSSLVARMTNDIQQVMIAVTVFCTKVIREPLKAMACIAAAMFINWRLTLTAVLLVPLIGILLARFGKLLKKAANSAMNSIAVIYECISETFDSFRIVSALGGQQRQLKKFLDANKDFYYYCMKTVKLNALVRPTSEIFAVMIVCIAFTPGAYMVLRQTDSFLGIQLASEPMSITELMMFYVMLAGTLDPVRKMSSVFGAVKQGLVGAERAFELIDRPSLITEPQNPRPLRRHRTNILFESIQFAYSTFDGSVPRLALDDVTLNVNYGEVVAVIGTNGSGKSTLLSLLPRFMDPNEGRVCIDGIDIREYSTTDLRSQMGLVTQETMLFDDTVFENIRYGSFDATEAEVKEAAVKAHAWEFIQALPEGMATRIGPGGRLLSGGQRQRLALARAIIRDPAILILDEATSAVDAESEDMIHGVLKQFSKGRTVFIITHVLSETFLDLVSRIVVMDRGRISAVGTHEELLQTCDVYRRLTSAGNTQKRAA